MFTGIVEETGTIEQIQRTGQSIRLKVRAKLCAQGTRIGDSIAVNGCCLTVTQVSTGNRKKFLHFDLLRETWNRTSLSTAKEGSLINLERSLAANGRINGHFVTGHIDGTGHITRWEQSGADYLLEITVPTAIRSFLVPKGCLAIDGISLTIAELKARKVRIWIIPHTYQVTALKDRQVGDPVNLEADILAKYVSQLLSHSA